MPGGRPTHYTAELGDRICELISSSKCGLSKLCRENPELPATGGVIHSWLWKHPEFKKKYFEARAQQQLLLIDDMNDDIDDDVVIYVDEKGNERIDSPSVALANSKSQNKKWAAARLAPWYFSEKKQDDDTQNSLIEKLIDKMK